MRKDSQEQAIKSILATERAWSEAHQPLDIDTLAEILSDDFIKLQPDGSTIDKEQLLASYQDGERHWEIAESTDHLVRLQGETAVVVGQWRGRGVNRGEAFDYTARFISVYVYQDGAWRMLTETSIPIQYEPS